MKLYNANLSSNCLRVRVVAHELGLDLDIVDVDLQVREHKTDAFLAMNSNEKLLVLEDAGVILWESRAINAYLAAKDPAHRLYPDEVAARAVVDQWSYWQSIHLGPAMQRVGFERVLKSKFGMGEPDESLIESSVTDTEALLEILDTGLAGREWITGALSLADFALARTFPLREAPRISLATTPKVAAWIERMEARESWKAAVAPVAAFLS